MVSEPLLFVILALATFRIGRFISLDTLWEGTRNKILAWLEQPGKMRDKVPAWGTMKDAPSLWRHKLATLIGCPFCVTVWAAAAVVFITDAWFQPLPMPVLWWLAVAGAAVLPWAVTDSE